MSKTNRPTPPIEEAVLALEAILDDEDERCPSPIGDEILDIINTLDAAQAERDELVAALQQAQDTLAWAQHFSYHANTAAFTDTLAITEAALAKIGGAK